jgi:hypothetical protein
MEQKEFYKQVNQKPAKRNTTRSYKPVLYSCKEAEALYKWGRRFVLLSFVVAALLILDASTRPMISYNKILGAYETYGFNTEEAFSVDTLLGALTWIGIGFAFQLIVSSLAIVVEASYRSIMKQESEQQVLRGKPEDSE